jgi:hypothetical protein
MIDLPATLIYFILTADHRWEFLTAQSGSRDYCERLQNTLVNNFTNTPGNIRLECLKPGEDI